MGKAYGSSVTILIYGVVFHNPCLCESDLTYGMQRYVAGSRALYAPERRLPLSNRIAICLSRIDAEVGIHERVDTSIRFVVACNPYLCASDLSIGCSVTLPTCRWIR